MKVCNRLKASQLFAKTIKTGLVVKNESFVIHYVKNELTKTRIGISVSSKLAIAVERNRIKRQVRAMCNEVVDMNKNYDVVIIVKNGYLKLNYQSNKDLLELAIKKIGINK